MNYDLPKTMEIGGVEYSIRYDFRAILDILEAFEDVDLRDQDKLIVAMDIFYPNLLDIPNEHYKEALEKCMEFINGGETHEQDQKVPRIMSWSQDFSLIIGPINRVVGADVRGIPYDAQNNTGGFHWWSFLSAYMEIGDCLFAQVVSIRNKLAKGKKLDKPDRDFYKKNRKLIDLKKTYSQEENKVLDQWIKRGQ